MVKSHADEKKPHCTLFAMFDHPHKIQMRLQRNGIGKSTPQELRNELKSQLFVNFVVSANGKRKENFKMHDCWRVYTIKQFCRIKYCRQECM